VLGAVIGLAYAWIVQPVEYVDTSPASLRADFKDQYRALIAAAYAADGDLVRARARLELLEDTDVYQVLYEQAQRTLARGDDPEEARALGLLAIALGQEAPGPAGVITPDRNATSSAMAEAPMVGDTALATWTPTIPVTSTTSSIAVEIGSTHTPEAPSLANAGLSSGTPEPSGSDSNGTPTGTLNPLPGGPFILAESQRICDQKLTAPSFEIQASNAQGQPMPGIEVIVTWDTGVERFFTGLKAERGLGFADFKPVAGVSYAVRLGENGVPALDLQAVECQAANGDTFWGTLLLKFVQP
jgi:hypothetical protein